MRARRSFLTGLLGQGIGPSLSPEMHEREAARQGVRYVYKTIDLLDEQTHPERLRELLAAAVDLGFDGLNVTHPVKQTVVPLVDRVSDEVAAIGALNTVLIGPDGTTGHNTDVTGFARAFAEGLAGAPRDTVLLVGAGGAGTAVAHALVGQGVQRLLVTDTDAARGDALRTSVRRVAPEADVDWVPTAAVPEALAAADGVVNATPLGMAAHPGTAVPVDLLRPELWVADIVYRPLLTELLEAAAARGCRTLSGAGMAVHQAADAFELITGRPADRAAMFDDFDALVAAEVRHAQHTTSMSRNHPDERNT